jgi:hypothetical protein
VPSLELRRSSRCHSRRISSWTRRWRAWQGRKAKGLYVLATVDVEDLDCVTDAFIDRLLELQIDEGLPIYIVPVSPLAVAGAAM